MVANAGFSSRCVRVCVCVKMWVCMCAHRANGPPPRQLFAGPCAIP